MGTTKIKFIIPLGGLGKRFSDANYTKPKPLISVLGKCIINWVIDCIPTNLIDSIIIPYHKHLDKFNFESKLRKDYPDINLQFIKLENNTKGAADTVLYAINKLIDLNICECSDNNIVDIGKYISGKYPMEIVNTVKHPIICMDGDNFYTEDVFSRWQHDNGVYLFEDTEPFEIYSYSKIEKDRDSLEYITDIAEKKKISSFASTGIYTFSSIYKLKQYCELAIKEGEKQNGEYYMSNVIKMMIKNGEIFKPYYILKSNYKCLGTPIQIRSFAENNLKLMTNKRYCFDLDNTLLTYPIKKGDYTTVNPIKRNIDLLKKLKELGNTIIIYTARRMKTHNGNINKVFTDQGIIVFETLKKFNIPYDEIYFGKPHADYYIDDLAVSAFSILDKELGFYDTNIQCRQFNNIIYNDDIIIKKSIKTGSTLKGEILFYVNIPQSLENLFPKLIKYDSENYKWYEMSRIYGVPASKLYMDEELSKKHLKQILDSLSKLHNYKGDNDELYCYNSLDIYQNYYNKLSRRYIRHSQYYQEFEGHYETFTDICRKLKEYEEEQRGNIGIIHGDPVFTNIIIDNSGNIRFIDMRGKQGNNITIMGDINYDYAKIYQSLIGYDEILEDGNVNLVYKNRMIKYFEELIIGKFGQTTMNDIKTIVKSLLFSLLPLHCNDKCESYYGLINTF